jgi:hypothetical protein
MTTPENFTPSACFTVVADADTAVLSRVVEYFVVLDILPDFVKLRRYAGGRVEISVKVRGLDEARLSLVAHKLRQIVAVNQVSLEVYAVGGDINDYRERRQMGERAS